MSSFGVTVETIETVEIHPNADRLELAKVAGSAYQFAIVKGAFKSGDLVVYFPIDSVLPVELSDKLGVTDKLSKGRVKTVKLRGAISQGLVISLGELGIPQRTPLGTDFAEPLGVVKYEPPDQFTTDATLKGLSGLVRVYDIENAEKWQPIVDLLLDQPVIITEKVEGSHLAISLNKDGEIKIYQRRYEIVPIEGVQHTWWTTAQRIGLIDKMPVLSDYFAETIAPRPLDFLLLRGELAGPGVQGNYYDFKQHHIYAFELEVNGTSVGASTFWEVCQRFGIETAPVLNILPAGNDTPPQFGTLSRFLEGKTIQEASNGSSAINPAKIREGIVVRPIQEAEANELGRVIIKQRSPVYLAKTEY